MSTVGLAKLQFVPHICVYLGFPISYPSLSFLRFSDVTLNCLACQQRNTRSQAIPDTQSRPPILNISGMQNALPPLCFSVVMLSAHHGCQGAPSSSLLPANTSTQQTSPSSPTPFFLSSSPYPYTSCTLCFVHHPSLLACSISPVHRQSGSSGPGGENAISHSPHREDSP